MKKISIQEIKNFNRYKIKKYRQQDKVFIAEGSKIVFELLQSNVEIRYIVISNTLANKYNTADWGNTEILLADDADIKKLSNQKQPDGIIAVCKMPIYSAETLNATKWIIALDGLNDPGNMGTIIRLADWFDIDQIICNTNTVDAYNPKVVQSTMGSIGRIKIIYDDFEKLFPQLTQNIYAADLDGVSIYEMKNTEPGILIIGNESHGVSEKLNPFITKKVTIPRIGNAESLNAGVATGILLSHLVGV